MRIHDWIGWILTKGIANQMNRYEITLLERKFETVDLVG